MTQLRISVSAALVAACLVIGASLAPAQEAAPAPVPQTAPPTAPSPEAPPAAETPVVSQPLEQVTPDSLEELRKQVEASTELSDDAKKAAIEAIEAASAALNAANDFSAAKANYVKQAESVDASRKKLDADLAEQQRLKIEKPEESADLAKLEQTLVVKQQELLKAQAAVKQADQQIEDRNARQRVISERLAAIPGLLEAKDQELAQLANSTEPPLLVQARRFRALAERRRLNAEPEALQAEAAAAAAESAVNLLQLYRQFWNARLTRLKEEVDLWRRDVVRSKQKYAAGRAELARESAVASRIAEVQDIYRQNADIAEEELEVRSKLGPVQSRIDATKREHEALVQERSDFMQREGRIGASTAFGIRLREKRKNLPPVGQLWEQIRHRTEEFVNANLKLLDLREKRKPLDHLDDLAHRTAAATTGWEQLSDDEQTELEASINRALELQRQYLDELIRASEDYIDALDNLNSQEEFLAKLSAEFREYIDERVLWIPSHRAMTFSTLVDDQDGLSRLTDRGMWEDLRIALREDALNQPWLAIAASFCWLTLLAAIGRQRNRIRAYGQKASSRLNTSMSPTWSALFWTILKSVILPLPFAFIGWRCLVSPSSPEHVHEFGRNILYISVWLWWLELVRSVCRPHGLGEDHFQWPPRVNQTISKQLSSFLALSTPIVLTMAVLNSRSTEGQHDSLERATAIAFFLLLGYTLHRLTSHSTGIMREWIEQHSDGWVKRFSGFWHLLAVAIPLLLAGLTVAGYMYAAERLCFKLAQTLMLLFAAVMVRSLLARWLMLRQRRLAVAQAREARAALAQADGEREHGSTAALEAQEARINLVEMSAQSKRLLNTTIAVTCLLGLGVIWQDVLPALRYFDNLKFLGSSISSLAYAALAVILTATAARNVPGLLEITILERLPLDRSARYAIGVLTRYAIVLMGLSAISNILNIQWDKVQWLAAALTFGLGFGLQEIFANFISGLIILFEQPVRVGDVVTIDNISGTVSRIRTRSTTITDWDRKEYIVPNKEFITGKLLNWTLTDSTNRIVINVAVAHGSDPDHVRQVLMNVVTSQPLLLSEPGPVALFDGFTENGLNFVVRAFLPDMDRRTDTIHMLHTRIYQAFQQAGIRIPYPQRDLYLKSMPQLPSHLAPAMANADEGNSQPEESWT